MLFKGSLSVPHIPKAIQFAALAKFKIDFRGMYHFMILIVLCLSMKNVTLEMVFLFILLRLNLTLNLYADSAEN